LDRRQPKQQIPGHRRPGNDTGWRGWLLKVTTEHSEGA